MKLGQLICSCPVCIAARKENRETKKHSLFRTRVRRKKEVRDDQDAV